MIPTYYSKEEFLNQWKGQQQSIEPELPDQVKQRIKNTFGRTLTASQVVTLILNDIHTDGDAAIVKWTKKLDGVDVSSGLEVTSEAMITALEELDSRLRSSLELAMKNIYLFHQKQPVSTWFLNDPRNGMLGQVVRPIDPVGIYVPSGTAPLPSTVLMTAIPAVVAGSKNLIITSPPRKDGTIDETILATCQLIKQSFEVNLRVFRIGGVQAIGALAFGTEQVPSVDKIVGPGNIFVQLAKKEVMGIVGIDGIAGPTEALIIADDAAPPELVAADLLAQAEHDYLAVPILLTTSERLAKKLPEVITDQLQRLSRAVIARESLSRNGAIVITRSLEEAIDISNIVAPEHLSLMVQDPWNLLPLVKNAGATFLGSMSCHVLGDYVAGPSHVLPTGRNARFSSALSVLDFVKFISIVAIPDDQAQELAFHAERIALAEQLDGHACAARLRTRSDLSKQA